MAKANMAAMVVAPETIPDPSWYPDSEATNHDTPKFSNPMHCSPYHGQDQLHLKNSQGLSISHISYSEIILSSSTSSSLSLNDLLYIPSIAKILVCVFS